MLVSWQRTVEGLRRTGVEIPASDTPREVAAQVGTLLGGAASEPADALEELAEQATTAAYSGDVDTGDPQRCEALRVRLQRAAVSRLPLGRRLVWRLLPS